MFRVKPNAHTAMNDASTETGSARPVMTVERHELRKRNTTSTVSSAPSISASCTLRTACFTRRAGVLHDLQLGARRQRRPGAPRPAAWILSRRPAVVL